MQNNDPGNSKSAIDVVVGWINEIYTNNLDTSEKILNFHKSGIGTSRMAYGYGMLGIMLEKGRYDGHQDANYCILKAEDGNILYNFGNVTSHSFDNRL